MAKKRIVVCGGNGFLDGKRVGSGSRICKVAVGRGWDVVSISRSGEPVWSSVTASPRRPSWSSSVSWQKADMLRPATYRSMLKDADAVVHSMGILLEADYKGVLTGKEPIWSGLSRAFSATKAGSQNPLERKDMEGLEPQEHDGQLTYELMNRDTAINLAQEASLQNIPSFLFISAAAGAPLLPKRYLTTKRDAESTIASSLPKLRSVFIRPGFLYDSSRAFTLPIAFFGTAGNIVNSMIGGRLAWLAGAAVEKPLKADLVAEGVMEAIEDTKVKGVIGTTAIEELAAKAWRRNML
ncbi:hypothetical protein MMC07_007949 [Pseudocyphellaria aurata]|nr:hypothetical protein [Pseudocyphellaria aurata]